MSTAPKSSLHIAIVGGGIAGLALGIGLQARNVSFAIYERAPQLSSSGAGLGLSPNAEWAMKVLSPRVHAAYERVANPNGEDYFQWVNGETNEMLFKLYVGQGKFMGFRRSELLEELLGCLPSESVKFGKALSEVRQREEGGACVLLFEDGTEEVADAVIGCDGIHSRLREQMFPSSTATYTHKSSFRTLIPMDAALARLGPKMTSTRYMYNGPGAHIITYPVAGNTYLNALAVVSDPNPWPMTTSSSHPHTGRATRDEARRAFAGWHPDVRQIVDLLPEVMENWAVFDHEENPVPRYHDGRRAALAGDAAHAVGPHLGAGAGFGIEDACLLAELLRAVDGGDAARRGRGLEAALEVYSEARYERTQWLVRHTREIVDLFEWEVPEVAKDPEAFGREVSWRFHRVWDFDVGKMVEDARRAWEERVRGHLTASGDDGSITQQVDNRERLRAS